jgi:hypothetical protein
MKEIFEEESRLNLAQLKLELLAEKASNGMDYLLLCSLEIGKGIARGIGSNEKEICHGRVSWQARSFDKEFAPPVGWVGIENRLRERPRMSPWVEERALAFAIHVIRGFSEYTSTRCLGA